MKFGTKGIFGSKTRPTKKTETARVLPKIKSHPSIDSGNTISNSSLQDYNESEFTGTELATYMKEINIDLITWQILMSVKKWLVEIFHYRW